MESGVAFFREIRRETFAEKVSSVFDPRPQANASKKFQLDKPSESGQCGSATADPETPE